MALDLSALEASVEGIKEVVPSVVALLGGLKTKLDEAIAVIAAQGVDVVKLQEFSTALGAQKQTLAEAVVAHTPAEGGGGDPPVQGRRNRP